MPDITFELRIMTQAPLVFIIEPDNGRRKILSLLVRAASPVGIIEFASFDEAKSTLLTAQMVLCPWSEGGEELLSDRLANRSSVADSENPHLILLTHEISAGMIGAAQQDGCTDLIPSDPLNLNALRNRVLLCLEGPSALAARLSRGSAALRQALETFPGLRRRLAA